MRQCWRQKRRRNRVAAAEVVVAVAAAVATIRKGKKIGQGKGIRQFREPMEMRTGQRRRNVIDKWRKIDKLNLIRNNKLRTNNNPNHNNHKWKRIQKSMKTKRKGVQNQKTPFHSHNTITSPSLEDTLAILNSIPPGNPREYKEKEPEPKQPKLQQYAGLMGVIEKFHEIMQPIIEEEKKKPQVM
ncbi:MAG: hypothetical protein EZS28_038878 [Streblomastix strix]|uniref:Uncharacterized protein n=1 Tax=Streblomastix strix TaxID=222440 RepID=A0A5J4U499_9EUKA|nr:MAG: hypothetical protein EZS28_038878 [Streblomastix strix]